MDAQTSSDSQASVIFPCRQQPFFTTDKSSRSFANRIRQTMKEEAEICEICYEAPGKDKDKGEQFCMLSCGHKFGHKCMQTWLSDSETHSRGLVNCPKCRAPFRHICGHALPLITLPKAKEVHDARVALKAWSGEPCEFCRKKASFAAFETAGLNLLAALHKHGSSIDSSFRLSGQEYRARLQDLNQKRFDEWVEWWTANSGNPKHFKDSRLPKRRPLAKIEGKISHIGQLFGGNRWAGESEGTS